VSLKKEMFSLGYRLFQLRRPTGARGVRWFDKGEYGMGRIRFDGEVETYAFHPLLNRPIGHCIITANAIKWMEPEPMIMIRVEPSAPEGEYLVGFASIGTPVYGPKEKAQKCVWSLGVTHGKAIIKANPNIKVICVKAE
jgi:hypothetical protein